MKKIFLYLTLFTTPSFAINSQSYFKNTYEEARKDFIQRGQALSQKYSGQIVLDKVNYQYAVNENFEINYLYISKKPSKNLVIIQSGTHGIEGHTGSGVQNFILDYIETKPETTTNFLIIHGVNQYGFETNRRVNYNNVDLNRNFQSDTNEFQSTNSGYEQVNYFLNPTKPIETGFFPKIGFYIDALKLIYKYSKDTLKRAILKGQYQFEKGLYFGGHQYQPEYFALNQIWDKYVPKYEKVLLIDIHTGYGKKGKLHLLANSSHSKDEEDIKNIFKPQSIDFGDDKEFYQVKGDLTSYFQTKYTSDNRHIYSLAFEFGTLDSQKLLGSIDSIYRMIAENQGHFNGYKDATDKNKISTLFSEMFYPKDFAWRDSVLDQSKKEIDKILSYFEE
ncbi:MAG: DUF2817 domain-containing protein [Bdellovibrionales bacterium]|nr:DUF2817 domain-containing protein [Bdellovibrionales bacterium]